MTALSRAWLVPVVVALVGGALLAASDSPTPAIDKEAMSLELLGQAESSMNQDDFEQAALKLEAAVILTPSPEIKYTLGTVYVRLFERKKAIAMFKQVLEQKQDHRQALAALFELYTKQKNYKELESLLKSRVPAGSPALLMVHAQTLQGAQRIQAFQDALTAAPDSEDIARMYLGILLEEKQFTNAAAKAEELLGDHPTWTWTTPARARALANLGKTDEADKLFLDSFKNSEGKYFQVVMEEAMAAYPCKKLLPKLVEWAKSRPDDFTVLYYLGNVAVEADDFDRAERTFQHALSIASDAKDKLQFNRLLAAAYYQRATVAKVTKDEKSLFLGKAEKLFLQVIEDQPKDVQAMNNLAYLYAEDRGLPDKALPYARRAAKLQPDGKVSDTLGWTLALLADREKSKEKAAALRAEAANRLEHSIDLEPSACNLYHLGWTFEKSGRTKEAIDLYRQALKKASKDTDPVLRQINEGLKRLGGS